MLDVELFTDPACPFAFSAEPVRLRLRWHYGEHLRWTTRMIVLTREPGEADKLAEGAPGLQRRHGMPIDPRPYARPASCELACRAVVAVRLHAPAQVDALLRGIRIRVMQTGLIDDPALIAAAASDAGVDPDQLARWSGSEAVTTALECDATAAREPLPAARALDHKLGGPRGQRRYTAPTYLIDGYVVPGFNPIEAYEAVIANRAPDLPRRAAPADVNELLRWSPYPLATAEIALIMQTSLDQARDALTGTAAWHPAGADGYWTLAGPPA